MGYVSHNLGPPPWSRDALEEAYMRDFRGTWAHIKTHPGHSLHSELEGVKATFSVFEASVVDFRTAVREFHDGSHFGRLFDRPNRQLYRQVQLRIRQSVFCAVQAAMALVDHTRRFSRKVNIPGYWERVTDNFANNSTHRFLKGLRNHLAHVQIVDPLWHLSNSLEEGRKTRFLFKPDQLLSYEDWDRPSREFLQAHPEGVDLEKCLDEYLAGVDAFQKWFIGKVEESVGEQIQEYLKYETWLKAVGARTWWNLILRQVVGGSGLDPYNYLDRYLTPSELEEVLRLPFRSKAQVDKIIEIVDEYGCCNEKLRRTAYEAFGILQP
jgi:hypothetical protein